MSHLLTPSNLGIDPDSGQFATVAMDSLRVGAKLHSPIYEASSDRNVLLLAAGTTITKSILELLASRGISRVRISRKELRYTTTSSAPSRPDVPTVRSRRTLATTNPPVRSALAEKDGQLVANPNANSYLHKIASHKASRYDAQATARFSRNYAFCVRQVEDLFTGLSSGAVRDATQIAAMSSESLLTIAEDLDLFVAVGLQPAMDKYPCKHSLQTAMLAMSVGTVMGLTQSELIELGIGCFVHDAGMLHINPAVVTAPKVLSRVEFLEITKHPLNTFDLLKKLGQVPSRARLVAYQMHERCDGSGYPRRRYGKQIHPLARIAAVADVFIALISPRPHRPGMLPYHAMEVLIRGARNGLYDPAVVRALLHTVSLFPIGSFLETSDGRVGKVLRANRESYTRPVVEIWEPNLLKPRPEIVDLNSDMSLRIVRAIEKVDEPQQQEELQQAGQIVQDFWE